MSPTPAPPRRTLIVEDDEVIRMLVRMLVDEAGWAYDACEHGAAALEHLRTAVADERPEVVLLDMQMPIMDGFEFLRHARSDPELSTMLVIGISAWAHERERQKILEAGCDAVIFKPFDPKTFIAQVQAFVDARRGAESVKSRCP